MSHFKLLCMGKNKNKKGSVDDEIFLADSKIRFMNFGKEKSGFWQKF